MRILGIDYGDRRVGLAVADTVAPIATALPTIQRSSPEHDLVEAIRKVCGEQNIDRAVVGVPINMDGTVGPRARLSQAFADALRENLGIEVETWDERLTTRQADRAMLAGDLSRKKRKQRRDQLAAQLLLQNYLDAKRPG